MAWLQADDPGGGDWWTSNAPPDDAGGAGGSDEFAQQLSALYARYGRSAPDAGTITAHRGNPGGLAAIEKLLQGDGGSRPGTMPNVPSGNGGSEADIRAQIAKWAAMPGADPSLAADPDYWVRAITSKGGLTDANRQYWQDASVGPNAFFNNPNREAGGGAPNTEAFSQPPSAYASDPNAPSPFRPPDLPAVLQSPYAPQTWSGGLAPTAPNFEKFVAPTMTDLQNSPGYMARLAAAQKASERGAAAHGSVLNGGTQTAIGREQQTLASNEYGNLFGQRLAGTQANNATLQAGFGDSMGAFNANYGIFSAGADRDLSGRQQNASEYSNLTLAPAAAAAQSRYQQYLDKNARTLSDYITNTTTQRNSRNDYWAHLNDLYQGGLSAANGSYKPGVTM